MSDNADMQQADSCKIVHHAGKDAPLPLSRTFSCARQGIQYAWRSQRNLKIHIWFALAAVILGFVLQVSEAAWIGIVLCIVIVMSLEVANTAIESVVDLVSPEWSELAKRAKDCAAGAVYLAAIGSIVVAAIIFIPRIIAMLFG